jgi:hypothetical protein
MIKNSFLIASIIYLAIFCSFSPLQGAEINKTYPKKDSIKLKAILGSCKVIKSKDDKIHINVTYSFRDDEYQANFSESDGNLFLEEEFLEKSPKGTSYWIIAIPEETRMNFSSGTGNFILEGVKSEIKGETGTGSITIHEGKGYFHISTGTGSIEVKKSIGKFDLTSGTGDVNITDLIIEGSSKFSSGMGNVNVTISSSPNFDISVVSGMGDAILNFNGNPLKGCFEFTARQDAGRIVSPVKFEKEETTSDEHFQYDKKSFRVDGQNIPRIQIETGAGLAKLFK